MGWGRQRCPPLCVSLSPGGLEELPTERWELGGEDWHPPPEAGESPRPPAASQCHLLASQCHTPASQCHPLIPSNPSLCPHCHHSDPCVMSQ